MEHTFIAIAPKSTQPRSCSTWLGPIYGSNRNLIFKLSASRWFQCKMHFYCKNHFPCLFIVKIISNAFLCLKSLPMYFYSKNHFQSSSSCRAASTDIPDPSRHFSLSFIASGRSSGLHPVSSHSCCMYFRAGHPAFARPYVGVHRSTSLMSSSLLLQQCAVCLVRLTWIVFVMGGRWPYSWCFVGCCRQELSNTFI